MRYIFVHLGTKDFPDHCRWYDVTAVTEIYAPSADADDDGLPDPGAVPLLSLPSGGRLFRLNPL